MTAVMRTRPVTPGSPAQTDPIGVSIAECAHLTGLSRPSVRRRCRDGTLGAFRVGQRRVVIPVATVDDLLGVEPGTTAACAAKGPAGWVALNVRQFARAVHCAPVTIQRAIRRGELHGVRVGRVWLIPRPEVVRVLELTHPDRHRDPRGRPHPLAYRMSAVPGLVAVSAQVVRRAIASGALRSVHLGGACLVTRDEIDAYARLRQVGARHTYDPAMLPEPTGPGGVP